MLSKGRSFFPFSPQFMEELNGGDADGDGAQEAPGAAAVVCPSSSSSSTSSSSSSSSRVKPDEAFRKSEAPPQPSAPVPPLLVVEVVPGLRYLVGVRGNNTLHLSGFGKLQLLYGCFLMHGYSLHCEKVVPFRCPVWQPSLRAYIPEKSSEFAVLRCNGVNNATLKQLRSQCSAVFIVEGQSKETQEWLEAMEDQELYTPPPPARSCNHIMPSSWLAFTSGCLGVTEQMSTIVQLSHLPASWTARVDSVLETPSSRVLVCGAKGVGKSTLARYLINRLLNEPRRAVFLLNCDLGQPELSVPGFVTIHRVTEPLLSAAHFNLHTAQAAYFLGDITSRREPDLFLAALAQLIQHYHSVLLPAASKDARSESGTACLVVNTDGFVQFMGAEVLNAVYGAIQPTHVLHLRGHKHSDMPFHSDTSFVCQYMPVEEGRSVPSRIRAVDLRALRLAAYFLRSCPSLTRRPRGRTTGGLRTEVLEDIVIRSANLTGGERGSLACALLAMAPVVLPLHCVVFNACVSAPDLAPSMLLAVANCNLAGFSLVEAGDSLHETVCTAHLHASGRGGEDLAVQVCYLRSFALRPSAGLGLVRAIDLVRGLVVFTTPFPEPLLTARGEGGGPKILLTLSTAIRLPTCMLAGTAFPAFPYWTAQQAGEGATPLRVRPNKKRKGHHNPGEPS